MLAVAMCPRSSRPCTKLQRHGQEAILRGRRRSRAPELGRERAGLGRGRQSRGGQPLPLAGCQGQPSTVDATAPRGCDSGAAPAQTCRGGACLQLRGVRQPGFGQRQAARQGLRPALPRGVMGAGRAGAAPLPAPPRACGVTRPAPAPALPALGGCSQPLPGKGRIRTPAQQPRTQPSRLPAISVKQRAPRASVSPLCKGSGSRHTEPRAEEALQTVSNSMNPKPRHTPAPQTPFPGPASTAPTGRAALSGPYPSGCAPPAAPQDNGGPLPAPPAPG